MHLQQLLARATVGLAMALMVNLMMLAQTVSAQVAGPMSPFSGDMPTVGTFNNSPTNSPYVGLAARSTQVAAVEQPQLSSVDMWYQLAELNSLVNQQQQELRLVGSQLNVKNNPAGVYKLFGNYEHVLVQPIQANNTGLIVETATGFSHVGFPWTIGYSPRVEFGLRGAKELMGFRTRYWHLDHNSSFTANAANGLLPVGRQGTVGYLSEDGDITTGLAFIESGTFFSKVKADIIDVELQRELTERVNFYAGIRYGKLTQIYNANTDQGIVNAAAEFRGFGPTVALQVNHQFSAQRVSIFGTMRHSLLFGHRDFLVVDNVNNITQTIGSLDVRNFEDGADALSNVSEIQFGARVNPLTWLALTVAIEGQLFTNVGGANPTAVFVGRDNGIAGDSPMDDSLGFIGLNVGSEIFW